MENSSSSDENSDVGYEPSPCSTDPNDQSTMSGDSFVYCRTYSSTSVFSEPVDDHHSCCSEASPSCSSHWSTRRSGEVVPQKQALLTRLVTKECKNSNADDHQKLDDLESLDLGMSKQFA